ncbi:Protein of unknown function [Leuconostoc citreum]|nr:Protein of unknown function [Leuconostoc citreum]
MALWIVQVIGLVLLVVGHLSWV